MNIVSEAEIEYGLVHQLTNLKYTHRPDIRGRKSLEQNFRDKFEALNRVRLTDAEFECTTITATAVNPEPVSWDYFELKTLFFSCSKVKHLYLCR